MLGDDHVGRMKDNTLKISGEDRFALNLHEKSKIEVVRLRGSWTSGQHQEVLIKLKSGIFVRISRTNGEDTFQIGAVEDGKSKNPMPDLKSQVPEKTLTCRDAYTAFEVIRKKWPRYEQASCQTFAQGIMDELFPKTNLNLKLQELEEEFM